VVSLNKFLAVSQPESANASSSDCAVLSILFSGRTAFNSKNLKISSDSTNSQSAASDDKTFQSWIQVKGFDDEPLQMNVFTLHASGGIICLLCF